MAFDPEKITIFAKTDARGQNMPFGIKAKDRTRHMYVIGKTGMGKSTLLENMAVQDIKNGEGMAFIDPHGATAETLLDYIPEERKDDVLYFAPFDSENPVAFNVMEDVGADKRHLVVSGLMSVFKKIWIDAWSARMEYILQNTLLALLEYPDSTLLGVNRMLSEKHYRKKVIDNITDPAVKSFWVDEFLNYNERYMQEAGDAIKNKIGQFTANPLIRNIIGQPKSSFDIRQMMDERKIIIMNLSKGLVGESNANLLGSMLTTRIYLAAMSRADMSQEQMREAPNFYFYVDEFQSFANATFADILSEARKYKLNLTIAHQYIEQMEEEVRNAVFGNVGTIVSFRVGPFDAEVLETIFAPKFYAVDICNLGFAQIYLTLMIDGIGSAPFSATTLPPIEQTGTSCKDMVVHTSRTQFSKPRQTVEAAITDWMAPLDTGSNQDRNGEGGGRAAPGKPSSGKKPGDGPKKSDGANGRGRSSAKSEKSLEDLRSVLAGMSQKESDKGGSVEKEKKEKSDAEKQPQQPKRDNDQKERSKDTNSPKRDSASEQPKLDDLKATLAKLVEKSSPPEKPKSDPGPQSVSDNDQVERSAKRSERKQTASVESAKREETDTQLGTSRERKREHVAQNAATIKQKQPVKSTEPDPFDPKVLERMMRVKTDDKTPLK